MKKAWFKVSELKMRIGIITDVFCDYFELQDMETGEYYIKHHSLVEMI